MWNDKNKIFDRHQCFLPSFLFGLLSLQDKDVPALLSLVRSCESSSAQDCPSVLVMHQGPPWLYAHLPLPASPMQTLWDLGKAEMGLGSLPLHQHLLHNWRMYGKGDSSTESQCSLGSFNSFVHLCQPCCLQTQLASHYCRCHAVWTN